MANEDLTMPVAVPPPGADPTTFYALFATKLVATWSPNTNLVIWVADEANLARVHSPMKSAMQFIPAGMPLGENPAATDTIVLQTWPTTYVAVRDLLTSSVPTEIRIENVDPLTVRAAVQPLFTAIGKSDQALDAFMDGNGSLRVLAGTPIGSAASGNGAPSPATPNGVKIEMLDAKGLTLNPVQFLSEVSDHVSIDKNQHPLLSKLDLDGWVEVVVVNTSGLPLANESYELFLGDDTSRIGTTDADGRIFEINIPAGSWAINLPNHPSFTILNQ